jgi:hypothetical protein
MGVPVLAPAVTVAALSTGIDRTRTLRGALCGAVAAAVWAVQQPLDKVVFASDYDDVELLGKALTQRDGWYPAGLALHMYNGALFGAVYANVARAVPLPPVLRGPVAALAQNAAFWPLASLSDRLHPARDALPTLAGNRRAFAQSTWRHLLFGVALGELERRLNAAPEPEPPVLDTDYSSNGHGSLEHAISGEPSS